VLSWTGTPSGSSSTRRGRTPCLASSQTRVNAWLVLEPASSASRSTRSNGTRLNSLTLRTGPRAAIANSGKISYPRAAPRRYSTDGISATSSSSAASRSASRLGKSISRLTPGANSSSR
jgi:hypothetical protein